MDMGALKIYVGIKLRGKNFLSEENVHTVFKKIIKPILKIKFRSQKTRNQKMGFLPFASRRMWAEQQGVLFNLMLMKNNCFLSFSLVRK